MKTRLLSIIGIIGLSLLITPASFGDNEFCNIDENLKIQEDLIKDDDVLVEFLKVFPSAKLTRANYVDESNPEQASMTWTSGVYSLDIHIWGFDQDNPSDCFFPGGYRMNAPHLPKMIGLDYHKDPKIVLEQIEELEPKYVRGGPAPVLDEWFNFEVWPTESVVRYPDFPTIEFTLDPAPSGPFESFYIEDIEESVPENRILVIYKIITPDGKTETAMGHFHLDDITQHLTKVSFKTPIPGEYSVTGNIFWQTDGKLFAISSDTVMITVKDPIFRGTVDKISIDKKLGGMKLFDWSRDENLILFKHVANDGADHEQERLATMTPDGNDVVTLPIANLTDENKFFDARFSPDGNHIHAYMDDKNIYRFDLDTKEIMQLTHQGGIFGFDYYHYDENKPENYSIIISVKNEETLGNFTLLDIGNGEQENSILNAHAMVFGFSSSKFDISPDGKKILFKKTNDAGYGWADRVLAYHPAHGDVVEIPNIQASCGSSPKWSPNGEMIVYSVSSCGRGAPGGTLHLTNLDGSYRETLLPYTNDNPGNFIISPDGTSIIYGVRDEHGLGVLTLAKSIPEFEAIAMIILAASIIPVILARNKLILR